MRHYTPPNLMMKGFIQGGKLKRDAPRQPQILYLFGAACINQDTVVNYIRTDNMSVRVCRELQAHGYLLDRPQVRR